MEVEHFIEELDSRIRARKKTTSRLYQIILAGRATQRLLQNFVLHRIPIKELWTRNILGIAARVEDYQLRAALVRNIYEEETGVLSKTTRHLETFFRFGDAVGLSRQGMRHPPMLSETKAVIEHNLRACNSGLHFTAGVASVLLLMEGQPAILSREGSSMEAVMRDTYRLPQEAVQFFSLHASKSSSDSVSELEDEHADIARQLLRRYCDTQELRQQAVSFLESAIELRHRHFDAILDNYYDPNEEPFRWPARAESAVTNMAASGEPYSHV